MVRCHWSIVVLGWGLLLGGLRLESEGYSYVGLGEGRIAG